ncbi:MAG TPA: hypothetical protein PLT57_10905, partial [Accumulibacter sp.]|nr:hypothetical protein [Accumulibacter sp.]
TIRKFARLSREVQHMTPFDLIHRQTRYFAELRQAVARRFAIDSSKRFADARVAKRADLNRFPAGHRRRRPIDKFDQFEN